VPDWWPDASVRYVQLSANYAPQADEAALRGWPVIRLDRRHLYMTARPQVVADALIDVLDALGGA